MRGRTAVWIAATVLVVALSALLPEAALGLQDRALEGRVRSQESQTADLSLLAELSPAGTLAMATAYQSRVALEQGRELDGEQAERIAVNAVNTQVFSIYYYAEEFAADMAAPNTSAASAQPWLYMSAAGENVIFWQVELAGTGYNPLLAAFGAVDGSSPFTATALVDDRSGHVVSLRMRWTDYAAGGTVEQSAAAPAEVMPTVAPTPPPAETEPAGELILDPYIIDQDAALSLCGDLVYRLVDGMASYSYGADIDIKAGTAYLRLDGEEVAVPMGWTAAELWFNG